MTTSDLAIRPRLHDYSSTRGEFATILAYTLGETFDSIYDAQELGIVGGCFCVVTHTVQGVFAQPVPEVILPCAKYEGIRPL